MLTAYRENGDDWRVEGENLPDNIIWLDLLDPTPEERLLVESRAKIRVPSKEALSEIEASSRLIIQRGVLYLSTPMVARAELQTTEMSPAGFVLTPNLLVTVRFKELTPFNIVAEQVGTDETLDCSVGIFTALLEVIVDRGADALEHMNTMIDKVSKSILSSRLARLQASRALDDAPPPDTQRHRHKLRSSGAGAGLPARRRAPGSLRRRRRSRMDTPTISYPIACHFQGCVEPERLRNTSVRQSAVPARRDTGLHLDRAK